MKSDAKNLNRALERILFEDTVHPMPHAAYGIHDRPGPTGDTDPEFKPTVHPDLPLKPTELMSSQLASERPPIEDENYLPASVSDLRNAASAIAGLVPPDYVEKFYMRMKDLLTSAEEERDANAAPKSKQVRSEEEQEEMPVKAPLKKESRAVKIKRITEALNILARAVKAKKRERRLTESLLWEAEKPPVTRVPIPVRKAPKLSAAALAALDEPDYDPETPAVSDEEDRRSALMSYVRGGGRPEAPVVSDEESRLQKIAQELQFKSGASGARQYLQALFDVIKYQISEVGIDKIDDFVKNELALDFLDLAVAGGVMSDEDASYYDQNMQELVETDEFRYFFGEIFSSGFSALKKASERDTLEQIAELGIPAAVQQTVFNQVMGRADKKDSTIVRRLEAAGITDPAEQTSILQTIRENFADLQETASEVQGDLIELMREKFESMSEQKKMQLVTSALGEASSWRDTEILKELENYINAAAQTGQEVDFDEVMSTLETIEDKSNPLYTKIMGMVQPMGDDSL